MSIHKPENVLSFDPNHDVKKIINNLIEHMDQFGDWDNPRYYNAETLKYFLRGTACVRLRA